MDVNGKTHTHILVLQYLNQILDVLPHSYLPPKYFARSTARMLTSFKYFATNAERKRRPHREEDLHWGRNHAGGQTRHTRNRNRSSEVARRSTRTIDGEGNHLEGRRRGDRLWERDRDRGAIDGGGIHDEKNAHATKVHPHRGGMTGKHLPQKSKRLVHLVVRHLENFQETHVGGGQAAP